MKLSVIVPVYNVEAFLPKCIESILAQTISEFELILVNDGSSDGSLRVMEDYQSRYPEKIRTVTVVNGGQGRARNIGLELAKGDYIGFVDSDDWILPDMFEKLYNAAVEENAELAICDFADSFSDGSMRHHTQRYDGRPVSAAGSSCNKLFKAELIGEERFPDGLWYEDLSFSARLLVKAKKTVYIPEALYVYRYGHTSTMHNVNSKMNLDIIKIMDGLYTFLGDERRDDFEFLVINHVLLEAIKRVRMQRSPDKSDTIRTLRAYVRRRIPKLFNCASYKLESRNRRIIMLLNYIGMDRLSVLLLKLKA